MRTRLASTPRASIAAARGVLINHSMRSSRLYRLNVHLIFYITGMCLALIYRGAQIRLICVRLVARMAHLLAVHSRQGLSVPGRLRIP
jgi:hypothetical protein